MTSSDPAAIGGTSASPEPVTGTGTLGHRATSVAVGVAATMWDRMAPGRDPAGWRQVAVGAVFEAEDIAAAVIGGLRRAAAIPRPRPGQRPTATADGTGPQVLRATRERMAETARQRMSRLARRGAAEEDRGRRRAADTFDTVVTAIATNAVVERVVDAQVDRLLRPLVATVLDDVLGQLEEDPTRIQALVRGQRESMVNELVGRIRQSAAAGDTAVERITSRMLRRQQPDGREPAGIPTAPAATPATATP
jgi:hypothetical protein